MNILKNNIMNIRLIEHRIYNQSNNYCIVEILYNGHHYSRLQECENFGLPIKYKNMDNVEMPINKHYIVVDNLYHPDFKYPTILVCMEKLDDNNYTLIANDIESIKLIEGKIPEPHK